METEQDITAEFETGSFETGSVEWHSVRAARAAATHAIGSALGVLGFMLIIWGHGWGVLLTLIGIVLLGGSYRPMRRHVLQGDFDPPLVRFALHTKAASYPETYVFRPNRWRRMWLRAGHRASTAWMVPALYWLTYLGALALLILGPSG